MAYNEHMTMGVCCRIHVWCDV